MYFLNQSSISISEVSTRSGGGGETAKSFFELGGTDEIFRLSMDEKTTGESCLMNMSILAGENPSAIIFCLTAPSGNISNIFRYFRMGSSIGSLIATDLTGGGGGGGGPDVALSTETTTGWATREGGGGTNGGDGMELNSAGAPTGGGGGAILLLDLLALDVISDPLSGGGVREAGVGAGNVMGGGADKGIGGGSLVGSFGTGGGSDNGTLSSTSSARD
jgi:hypothetical protein